MDSDSDSIEVVPDAYSSQFKEALMATIKRPYDFDEYPDLQQIVGRKSQIYKDRHLCGTIKTSPSHQFTKLNLEMYPDNYSLIRMPPYFVPFHSLPFCEFILI